MASEQEILADSEIKKFIETNEGVTEEIQSAAKELSGKEDAIPSLKKLLPALADQVLPIFFSYKTKDEAAAKKIVKLLRMYSAGKLKITYQADFPQKLPGTEWRKHIRTAINKANWFILLLPDYHSDDWDWCLFETGLFEAKQLSGDRLICLHHPDLKLPDQINIYQAVRAETARVRDLLQMIYVDKNPIPGMKPINADIQDKLDTIAQEIVDAILPPAKESFHQVLEPWLVLNAPTAAAFKTEDDLDGASIEDFSDDAYHLFDRSSQPKTFLEARSGLPAGIGDNRWRAELFGVIQKIAAGSRFRPIQAVFQDQSGKNYRPVVHAVDRIGNKNGPIEKYHISFTHDFGVVDTSEMPKHLSQLTTLLRQAFVFRWEIIEKFTKGTMTNDDVERVRSAFERVEAEWQTGGGGDATQIESLFPAGKIRDRVSEMFGYWESIRNPQKTGELDIAIEQKDAKKVQKILEKIAPLNQKFLEIVTEAFSEIIHETGRR